MNNRRPPLADLRAFEAAARHLSFTRAASELGVTQGAVSQRIRRLEDQLDLRLFERLTRAMVLTAHGRTLAAAVGEGLARIDDGLSEIVRHRSPQDAAVLTVSVTAAFASKWLLPRLARFQERYPEIEIRIAAEDRLADFVSDGVDLGIRFGRGIYPGLSATLLMPDIVFPVCSPALLNDGDAPLTSAEDLLCCTLLHDVTTEHDGSGCDWRSWFEAAGLLTERLEGLRLSPGKLVLEAAINGLGVALGRATLVNDDLAEGSLVRPLQHSMATTFSYYFVQRPKAEACEHLSAFIEWLREEAAAWLVQEGELGKQEIEGRGAPRPGQCDDKLLPREPVARKKGLAEASPARRAT
jgi:LysR family transcriptional regulator, glycine cleavage system transcriptional activator